MPYDPKCFGFAFKHLFEIKDQLIQDHKMSIAVEQMEYLAKGQQDAVAITRLSQLDIDVPFQLPLWNDEVANAKYWPQVQKWARRQLGLEVKSKACKECGSEAGFSYNAETKLVTCIACEKVKS